MKLAQQHAGAGERLSSAGKNAETKSNVSFLEAGEAVLCLDVVRDHTMLKAQAGMFAKPLPSSVLFRFLPPFLKRWICFCGILTT